MNAEIGIDEEGKAYIQLEPRGTAEIDMVRYMRSYLPITIEGPHVRIVGDRMPGSGKGG